MSCAMMKEERTDRKGKKVHEIPRCKNWWIKNIMSSSIEKGKNTNIYRIRKHMFDATRMSRNYKYTTNKIFKIALPFKRNRTKRYVYKTWWPIFCVAMQPWSYSVHFFFYVFSMSWADPKRSNKTSRRKQNRMNVSQFINKETFVRVSVLCSMFKCAMSCGSLSVSVSVAYVK